MNKIEWPNMFTPGLTDFFVSNEKIISGLNSSQIWPLISNPEMWPTYHKDIVQVELGENTNNHFGKGSKFKFKISDTIVNAEIDVFSIPTTHSPGQVSWIGHVNLNTENSLIAYLTWFFEDLSEGRLRILLQESLIGNPAKSLAQQRPNPALNAHYDWMMNLISAAETKVEQ